MPSSGSRISPFQALWYSADFFRRISGTGASRVLLVMANTRAPIPPVALPDNEVLMEDMALYAERVDLRGMMQEYLRR